MLSLLGRLERTRNIIIVGFAVLMAVSLVLFYAPGRRSANLTDPSKDTEVIAKVASDEITVSDLALLRENYQQMLGGQISLAQLGGNKRFLDGLIRDRVVAQEAARLGLAASDAEVADKIRKQFSDESGNFVGLDRYKESIQARYGELEKFESNVRDSIAQEKLKAFVTASVIVSDDEVLEKYKREKTSLGVSYIVLSADKLAKKLQVSDNELRSYYEQHKTDYRILEPQKKIRYVYLNQEKVGEKLPIADKDLHAEYDKLSPENKQAGVKVQQILLKVARKDLDPQVEQKAKDLVAKARAVQGPTAEQTFADLAKGNSEDPSTAKSGGFLSRPIRKNPNKADALYDRVVNMQPGEITDPVKSGNNWYILRRGEPVPKTFDEAKPELLVSLRNRRAYAIAAKLAEKARDRLKETKDPSKVSQELAAEANMSPADMVKETPYVKPGDDVPGIGSNQQFEQVIAPLNNPNDVGEHIGVKGGFAIPMLVDKKEPRVPDFDEVKTKVADVVKEQRAKEQLEQKAKELASGVSTAADLKAAADQAGAEFKSEDDYKLGSPLGEAGTSPQLDEAIFGLKQSEVTKAPIKVGDNWVVLGLNKRTDADLAAFGAERAQLTQSLLSERQNQVFEDYVATAQAKMKRDGKIKIYNEVLARMEEDEPAAAPQRFPFPTK